MIICLLLLLTTLSAADIVVTAEAGGPERATVQARDMLARELEQRLTGQRQALWFSALPSLPWDDTAPPAALGRSLADAAEVTVLRKVEARRFMARAILSEAACEAEVAAWSAKAAAHCRRLLAGHHSLLATDATAALRRLSEAINAALGVFVLPPDAAALPDSLSLAVQHGPARLIVAQPGDVTLREGENLIVSIRVYIDADEPLPLAGIPVQLTGGGKNYDASTDAKGWARFEIRQPAQGDWASRVFLLDSLVPGGLEHHRALRTFVLKLAAGETASFRVSVAGRRRTWMESNLGDVAAVQAVFERRGHVFVSDPQADWRLNLTVHTVHEGVHSLGGYVCVLEGSLLLQAPAGVTAGMWRTGQVEAFSSVSVADARRRAEAELCQRLLRELNK
ncbi:MAG: hypothetical protein K8R90_07415 [Candidatus Cloacimonetes bacterium]|nr:hypothetical protein [Candidatus Cloacimonadota bacterium]